MSGDVDAPADSPADSPIGLPADTPADRLERRCRALVEALGLAAAADVRSVRALSGGVASDIAVVDLPSGPVCVKFALPRLRVAAEWHAPIHRNAAEYAWLTVASGIVPASVPRLLGHSGELQGFAMEYLHGPDYRLWKSELLHGRVSEPAAATVGRLTGAMHAASTAPGFDAAPFRNRDDFRTLRLDPYLGTCADAHPSLAAPLRGLADALHAADRVLLHGDVSPKNVLLREDVPVLLDAECATMGDACFDVAFCLNHLVLKAVHRPDASDALHRSMRALWAAYRGRVSWEPVAALEARVCALLPALMLARVDGKSPVEYLDEAARRGVRETAMPLIPAPPTRLEDLLGTLSAAFTGDRP